MPEVVITVSLRPAWAQRMMHDLYGNEVTRRMEELATAALRQFSRSEYVTVTATDGARSRSILRDRWDVYGNPMIDELRAQLDDLKHRNLMLEERLRAAGIPLP